MADGLLLCDDLIFTSRVTGIAGAHGLTFRTARSLEALDALLSSERPVCVIIDLGHPGLRVEELVRKVEAITPRPRIVAYGSHVDAAGLKAAREAGCDLVLPRSAFVERLPEELPTWMVPLSEAPQP